MSWLAQPAVLAGLQSLAALVLLPPLRSERWLPWREPLLVGLLLLCAAGLVARALGARAGERRAAWLVAVSASLALAGLGLDEIRGQRGTVRLAVGQTTGNFEETGPHGRALGLRPLGFTMGLERVTADGVVLLLPGRGPVALTRGQPVALGSFRLSEARARPTGDAVRLRVAASDGVRTLVADVAPGQPGRVGNLVLSLERYFADFALDPDRQPFSRSAEPRNPGALLSVERDGRSHRAFVLQAMPGAHRVEPLGLSFSLLEVEPETEVVIRVQRQPFALLVLLGGLGLVVGASLVAARARRDAQAASPADGLLGGAGLVACLLLADGGSVLAWSFGVSSEAGRTPLEGVGMLLGVTLLAALAGTLLLAAQAAAPSVDVAPAAHAALWLAVLAGALGLGLAALRLVQLDVSAGASARPLIALALALLLLALTLRAWRLPLVGGVPADSLWLAVAPGTLLLVLGLGWLATRTEGTYATPGTAAAAAAALLALAASETGALRGLRRFAFLVSLLLLFLRPS